MGKFVLLFIIITGIAIAAVLVPFSAMTGGNK
jgi:hypothetical protein